ncbi:hypothetical protein PsorP6_016650 [Peronosclerospora sorghi]|uniref:Uncharacterized protein n=1 Tax=Peronosclerospora sorghi TaxID=230839 RepID=A0ACC0VLN4_9STRA|nr:hypothetical protein PsorP6_016650 [Peronosclerospora sorghi]
MLKIKKNLADLVKLGTTFNRLQGSRTNEAAVVKHIAQPSDYKHCLSRAFSLLITYQHRHQQQTH